MPRKSPNFGGPEIQEASNQPCMTFEITKKHRKDFLNVRWDDSYAARDVAFCWSGVNVRCHNKPFDLFNIGDWKVLYLLWGCGMLADRRKQFWRLGDVDWSFQMCNVSRPAASNSLLLYNKGSFLRSKAPVAHKTQSAFLDLRHVWAGKCRELSNQFH